MRNVILIMIISVIVINLFININYIFAIKNDSLSSDNNGNDVKQMNKQNIKCNINAKCNNQSQQQQQQQQTHQNIKCNINAKCTNYSTSNIVVCKERSVCLIQYEGPFELSNPY
jgi:predicted Holliday junction resolvase-like endonuclease